MSDETPVVLVVEDEPDLADLYAAWLGSEFDVRTAYGGREAIESLDDDVDVVLLDRRMPGLSGDEVLTTIRDRGISCQVAMVTAVEPDFDIVAMGFDDYLVKPVTREALVETVEGLLSRGRYDEGVQELFSLASKKALLEAEKSSSELKESEEYQELEERLKELRAEVDQAIESFKDHEDFVGLYQQFDREGDETSFAEAFSADDEN